jgi:hypothetical protein
VETVTVADVDARELLAAGPDGYTAARDAEVRRRKGERDRDGAASIKALGKPSLALWAVLAAADDAELTRRAVAATTSLAETQGAAVVGKGAEQIAVATAARKKALDAVTDAAASALAAHDKAATIAHRTEIRSLIDRVSRHPELLDDWLAGTLRDIPPDTGFEAFDAMTPQSRPRTERAPATRAKVATAPRPAERPAAVAREQRAKASEARARARTLVREAERDLAGADRAVHDAERALAAAEKAREAAQRRLETARQALEAN